LTRLAQPKPSIRRCATAPLLQLSTAGRAGTNVNSSGSGGGCSSGEVITASESQQLVCPREETEGDADHLLQEAAEPRHALLPRGALKANKRARLGAQSTLLHLFCPCKPRRLRALRRILCSSSPPSSSSSCVHGYV
jgi:hypothetical protein